MKRTMSLITLLPVVLYSLLTCSVESRKTAPFKVPISDTAKFLGTVELEKDSPLYPYTLTNNYKAFKEEIEESWNNFQGPNLEKIEKWREKQIKQEYTDTVFYPFSGPDIVNALAFYPDAKLYIMLGLETPGQVPKPLDLKRHQIDKAFNGLKKSLAAILRWNFFRTLGMEKNIGSYQFNGIIGVKMFLLARYGCTIVDARHIWIDSKGKLRYDNKNLDPNVTINGCELVFRLKGDKELKTSQFFQLDVRNSNLRNHTNFLHYLKKRGRFSTLIKAASYLMHYEDHSFTIMRSLVLRKSDFLIQDDTGIPLKYFSWDDWNLDFYGTHVTPIPLFEKRLQPALVSAIHQNSKGILPFSYGYYIAPGLSHVMVASSKKKL